VVVVEEESLAEITAPVGDPGSEPGTGVVVVEEESLVEIATAVGDPGSGPGTSSDGDPGSESGAGVPDIIDVIGLSPVSKKKPRSKFRKAARASLVRFVSGIEGGDVDMILGSIAPEIMIHGTRKSISDIEREYSSLIRDTSKRKYNFHIDSWSMLANNVVRVDGDADIRYFFHSSPKRVYIGRLVYYIVIGNGGGKLVKIEQG